MPFHWGFGKIEGSSLDGGSIPRVIGIIEDIDARMMVQINTYLPDLISSPVDIIPWLLIK
jgi:hypothetical protein